MIDGVVEYSFARFSAAYYDITKPEYLVPESNWKLSCNCKYAEWKRASGQFIQFVLNKAAPCVLKMALGQLRNYI